MSAQTTIQKLREDNLAMSALLKTQAGEPLSPEEKEFVAQLRKNAELEQRLAERYDLGGAILKALRNPSGFHAKLPMQDAETQKAIDVTKAKGFDTLEGAIIAAFARPSTPTRKSVSSIPSADGPRHGKLGGTT